MDTRFSFISIYSTGQGFETRSFTLYGYGFRDMIDRNSFIALFYNYRMVILSEVKYILQTDNK